MKLKYLVEIDLHNGLMSMNEEIHSEIEVARHIHHFNKVALKESINSLTDRDVKEVKVTFVKD